MAIAGACAIVIAPAVLPPPHPVADRAVSLVAEVDPVATGVTFGQGSDGLAARYDALRPALHYDVALGLWAGRFVPIPGAALYHLSVAYDTVVDPVTYSLVHNFDAFIGGDIDLSKALDNIGTEFIGAVTQFATTELNGHAGVVPPVSAPNAGAEPWVRWIITAAISPLYYLPLPNALTVDQVSILGRLVGTVVSSAIDNLGHVISNELTLSNGLANVWGALTKVAIPRLVADERELFTPPARSAFDAETTGLDAALVGRFPTIDGAAASPSANGAATTALPATPPGLPEDALSKGTVDAGAEPVDVATKPAAVDRDRVQLGAAPVEAEKSEPAASAVAPTGPEESPVDGPPTNNVVRERKSVGQESTTSDGDESPATVKSDDEPRGRTHRTKPWSGSKVPSARPVKPVRDRTASADETTKTATDEHGTGHGSTTQGAPAAA